MGGMNVRWATSLVVLSLIFTLHIQVPSGWVEPTRDAPALEPYDNPYLNHAESAARWLMSIAMEPAPGQYKWYNSDLESDRFMTEQSMGAVGVGKFFLELYHATGNGTYLEFAEGTGRWLISIAEGVGPNSCRWSKYEGWGIYDPDYLGGIGSTMEYLSMLYRSTGNSTYLDYAVKGANWLVDQAVPAPGGYKWKSFSTIDHNMTGWYHGTAGLSHVLMEIHSDTQNTAYLDYALGGAGWLISMGMDMGPGEKAWVRVEGDPDPDRSWCGGTIGIVQFFIRMWEATGNSTYLENAMAGANWTVGQGTMMGEGMMSIDHTNILCHGDPSHAIVLFSLHKATSDPKYLDAAERIMNWIIYQRVEVNEDELKWPHLIGGSEYITGLLMGNSGIGYAFMTSYEMAGNETYLDHAVRSANWVMNMSEEISPGVRRWNYKEDIDDTAEYCPGWYWGAAGIGQFLIGMSEHWTPPDRIEVPGGNRIGYADPGESVGYLIDVLFHGSSESDLDVIIASDDPSWVWNASFDGTGIEPGIKRDLSLSVIVPDDALSGDIMVLLVRLEMEGDPSIFTEIEVETIASTVRGILIDATVRGSSYDPGERTLIDVNITNTGNDLDDISIQAVCGSLKSPITIEFNGSKMIANEKRWALLHFIVPENASGGNAYDLIITAFSLRDPYISAETEAAVLVGNVLRAEFISEVVTLHADPGEEIPFTVLLRNTGNVMLNTSIEVLSVQGTIWDHSFVNSTQVQYGEEASISFKMTAPPTTLAGEWCSVVLGAFTSEGLLDTINLTLIARSIHGISLKGPEEEVGIEPYSTITISVSVRNTGNIIDDVVFDTVEPVGQWEFGISFNGSRMAPFEERTATLNVALNEALPPSSVAFILRAMSLNNASASLSIDLNILEILRADLLYPMIVSGPPGKEMTLDLELINAGNMPFDYRLSASSSVDLSIRILSGERGWIGSSRSAAMGISIRIPEGIPPGVVDTLLFEVDMNDGKLVISRSVNVTVLTLYDFDLSPSENKSRVRTGEKFEFIVNVTNKGNIPIVVELEINGLPPSWCGLSVERLEILPGGTESVIIEVEVPQGEAGIHVLIFEASSEHVNRSIRFDISAYDKGHSMMPFIALASIILLIIIIAAMIILIFNRNKRTDRTNEVWEE
ncbi:MAG: lanthionine synthetase LanC family protein [Candidatus Thermoplasmatota archaeon]|nr:lanthionine synthetase LanC family protein [Candidatus Thermoplasmatota archaeon]